MTDLRIVCTHDAVNTAEVLRRLLEAEEHTVTISYGRQSLSELANARAAKQCVLLIWSYEAPTTQYMREWATQIEPANVIEIGRANGYPTTPGHAPVIDFTKWNGERGGRAWNALNQRVKTLHRVAAPKQKIVAPRGPFAAALTLAAFSFAAVFGALVARVHDGMRVPDPTPLPDQITAQVENPPAAIATPSPADGVGGPLVAVEPLSEDYLYEVAPAPALHIAALTITSTNEVSVPDLDAHTQLRAPTLFERLADLNPLRDNEAATPPAPKP